jgi:catechol 2,3-dioxygenase-like lactoylglutathione lyase family enzyme
MSFVLDHISIQCTDTTASSAFVRDPDGNNVEAVCHAPE